MSKPYGMTAMFQIVRPSPAQNAIYDAVTEAMAEGSSFEDFVRESRECWRIAATQLGEQADAK